MARAVSMPYASGLVGTETRSSWGRLRGCTCAQAGRPSKKMVLRSQWDFSCPDLPPGAWQLRPLPPLFPMWRWPPFLSDEQTYNRASDAKDPYTSQLEVLVLGGVWPSVCLHSSEMTCHLRQF